MPARSLAVLDIVCTRLDHQVAIHESQIDRLWHASVGRAVDTIVLADQIRHLVHICQKLHLKASHGRRQVRPLFEKGDHSRQVTQLVDRKPRVHALNEDFPQVRANLQKPDASDVQRESPILLELQIAQVAFSAVVSLPIQVHVVTSPHNTQHSQKHVLGQI
jgi:hypothetical protein